MHIKESIVAQSHITFIPHFQCRPPLPAEQSSWLYQPPSCLQRESILIWSRSCDQVWSNGVLDPPQCMYQADLADWRSFLDLYEAWYLIIPHMVLLIFFMRFVYYDRKCQISYWKIVANKKNIFLLKFIR